MGNGDKVLTNLETKVLFGIRSNSPSCEDGWEIQNESAQSSLSFKLVIQSPTELSKEFTFFSQSSF